MRMDREAARRRSVLMLILASAIAGIAAALADRAPGIVGLVLFGAAIVGLSSWAASGLAHAPIAERDRKPQLALAALSVVHLGFCLAVAKLGHALADLTNASRGSLVLLGVAALIVLAPIVSRIWAALNRCALEPSTSAKISLGLVLLAVAWLWLGVGIEWSGGRAVGARALGACAATLILAATCFGLASSSAIDELASPAHRRPWLAIWSLAQLSAALGVGLAGRSSLALSELFESSVAIGLICVAVGVGLAFAWSPLAELTSAVERARRLEQRVEERAHAVFAGVGRDRQRRGVGVTTEVADLAGPRTGRG